MGIAQDAVRVIGRAARNVHAGDQKLVSKSVASAISPRINVTSPTFRAGDVLPISSTVDGDGSPPRIEWSNAPTEAKSFVLICEDPDAPFPDPYVHWIVYGIPAAVRSVEAPAIEGRQGKNSKLGVGFTPAAPPLGHGVHHYHFQLFALDMATDFDISLGRSSLRDLIKGHVLAWGELVGTYERT